MYSAKGRLGEFGGYCQPPQTGGGGDGADLLYFGYLMAHRILILNERDLANPLTGGAEVHTFKVFGELVRRGHEVTQLAASFPGCTREDLIEGIRIRRLANRYAYYGAAPLAARREFRRGHYDVVVDVLAKLPFMSPWFTQVPCLAVVHHLFGGTAFRHVPLPVATGTWLSERLIPPAYRDTPAVAVSPSTRDDLIERGLEPKRIRVIPNGVDHELYRPSDAPLEESPLIVWLGRIEPYKNLDGLLEAMPEIRRRVPSVRLAVVGSGSGLEAARGMSRKLGLEDCVEFTGFVDSERKVDFLCRAHVMVNTSEKEGWGLTVIEGNACGTPTVASNVPGLRDSVVDGETGFLVPHKDRSALVNSVTRILNDSTLRETMSRRCLAWASRFDWGQVATDFETVLDAVAEGRPIEGLELGTGWLSE